MAFVVYCITQSVGTSESLQFSPNVAELPLIAGNTAVLRCIVTRAAPGDFSWTGPAVSNGRASIFNYKSGVVSELTINGFTQGDVGDYTCSFTGVEPISTRLTSICKFIHQLNCCI